MAMQNVGRAMVTGLSVLIAIALGCARAALVEYAANATGLEGLIFNLTGQLEYTVQATSIL